MRTRYTISFCASDEFGIVPGSGYGIFERGKRIDWPMLETLAEAQANVRGFHRAEGELARDEASERRGLAMMAGDMDHGYDL